MKRILSVLVVILFLSQPAVAEQPFPQDTIKTGQGDLVITFIGHGTLVFTFQGTTVHIDPFMQLADYTALPKASLIFLTHHHRDHLDLPALNEVRTPDTMVVMTKTCSETVTGGIVMANGEKLIINGITVEAVPAYNLVHRRDTGELFHPKGIGNGYILTFADKRIYIAGDTENTPEMKALKDIDIAFLPMNLPYTMTPEMVADAARAFQPKILYPYHYGETDLNQVALLLQSAPVEVRIRPMK
ncbi:metal-dependent hydrolase [Desulfoluna limicola]|uniref:Metal-dependent hydrolase n=1 Tax=Desulfoluna limicola TaxID=2810562 RepID=A0ABM7PJ45_9BACT|nr:MBL fold metallo-hydrolase [Desulfoluna limicola]BCS97600.1 metal-dependent hydrolase [Desulfoluna limicola]